MAFQIPKTMRAVALSKYCKPSEYNIGTLPTPEITQPGEILIKVHAASVNPIDVKMASGLGKLMEKATFPYKLGYDLSGTVVSVHPSVKSFSPGDEVYTRVPGHLRGSIAQYALSLTSSTALKPRSMNFVEAASIPLAAQTALQAMYRADAALPGGLKGKTVLVPGGLSGTGSFAIQLAKNVFGAGKVITSLSTGKIEKIGGLLGSGSPDQIVDYTKENLVHAIGKGTVDFLFDTVASTFSVLPVMKKGGVIVSISTVPSGTQIQDSRPDVKGWLKIILNIADWFFRTWTGWRGVGYSYLFLEGKSEDLDSLSKFVEEGKIRTVVGSVAKLEDIEGVRKGCQQIYDAKGGIGKFVIEIE